MALNLFSPTSEEKNLLEGEKILDILPKSTIATNLKKLFLGESIVDLEFTHKINEESKILRIYGSLIVGERIEKRFILYFVDITDLINARENLQQQKNDLKEFILSLHHDMKNYLINILGYSELLLKTQELEYTQKIIANTLKIKNFLDISYEIAEAGKVIGEKILTDLNNLVDTVAEFTIPKGVNYSRNNLPEVLCDREKVAQVFQNLFRNAIIHGKATEIKIEACQGSKGEIILYIKNNGMLIPSEIKRKIFKKTYSSLITSAGFGLYIVKKIIEAHTWTISLENDQVPYTIFKIHIKTLS